MNPLVQLIISQIPTIAALIREAHAKQDPNAPPITSEQVIAAFEELFTSSFAKDEALKAALQAEIDAHS